MGALTFDALLRSLKQGAPDPVYYLHGEEDVLKDEAVRVLLERAVDPAARDFNVDQRSAADLDPETFNALVNTPPILAATRAVVLRGMEQLRKTAKVRQELLHYLDSRSEEHTSELQSRLHLVCRLLLEKKKKKSPHDT